MPNAKEIRRRIKSVKNTGKITRAMEMVAASKMRRAVAAVLAIRPYAHSAWSVLMNLARSFSERENPLLEIREVKNILAIAVSTNRGLCGPFNSQLARKIRDQIQNPERLMVNVNGFKKNEVESSFGYSTSKSLKIDFVTIGKKGEAMIRKLEKNIIASFPDLAYLPEIQEVRPLAKIVIEEYGKRNYDKVVIFYADYISTISQQTKVRQILPISKIDIEKQIAEMDNLAKIYGLEKPLVEYKVEPSPEAVLENIFPRLIEMQIYHAILESNASKESARMVAMRNATDAAKEMADNLTLVYNQIRQMKITQEIAEISAGRAALES